MVSATVFMLSQSEEMGIDPKNILVSGSSAGGVTALTTERAICNGEAVTKALPAGFNYRGLISLSGAFFCAGTDIPYKRNPCPHLFFHGTADNLVAIDSKTRRPVPHYRLTVYCRTFQQARLSVPAI